MVNKVVSELEYEALTEDSEAVCRHIGDLAEKIKVLEAECERLRETNKMLQEKVNEHEETISNLRDYIQLSATSEVEHEA